MSRHTYAGLFILTVLLGLGGCASINALRPDVASAVDRWVANKEYQKALDTIEHMSPDHAQYSAMQARVPTIRRAAVTYEQQVIKQATKLAAEQRWQAALDAYEDGLDRLPHSEPLQKGREQLLQKRDALIDNLELRALISHARQLDRDLPVYRRMVEIAPKSGDQRRRLTQAEREARQVASELTDAGQKALEDGDSFLAVRCLTLADRLDPREETRAALTRAREASSQSSDTSGSQAQRQDIERERERRGQALVDEYRTAYAEGDLLKARKLLTEAAVLQPESREISTLRQQLNAAIEQEVEAGLERGRRLYTVGDVEGALGVWTGLLEYSPNDKQLNEHIDRAERVLRNLREIEGREPTVKLPGE